MRAGFTLIEVMLAVMIVSVISVAIYTTFAQGINLWKRALSEQPDLDVELFLEKAAMDLRNAFPYGTQGFSGSEDSFEFYRIAPRDLAEAKGKKARADVPVRIRYSVDRDESAGGRTGGGRTLVSGGAQAPAERLENPYDKRCVLRTEEVYQKVLNPKLKGMERKDRIASGLNACSFRYYVWDDHRKVYEWRKKWAGPGLPDSVKIVIGFGKKYDQKRMEIIPIFPGRKLG